MKQNLPTEHAEHAAFVSWFRAQYPNVLIFAIPNGEYRNKVVAMRLKAEGVLPGVPDLCIPEWYVYIEMKRTKGGRVDDEQKKVINYLIECGYTVEVCKGFEAARDFILKNYPPK